MRQRQLPAVLRLFCGTLFPTCVALSWALGATAVYADPVRTITSGTAYQIPGDGETGWGLNGVGFTFSGDNLNVRLGDLSCGHPCTPGESMNLSAVMTPYGGGTATLDGRAYDSVFYTGTFDFSAGSVTVPELAVGEGLRPGPETRFTFTGTLTAYSDSSLTGTPLFLAQLTGSGLANVAFWNTPYSGGVYNDGFDFRFTNAAITPEPTTLLLLGSGAAWLFRRRRTCHSRLRNDL